MAKQQILLVDADSSSARLLEVSLRSAGFNIAAAVSAEDALGKLEHGVPDLILTEARLPGVDGFSFVRTLRARPELAEVPVVFLTEQGALEDKLRGLELGVDDYLAKPIMVREVVTRVQLLLARKKQQRTLAEPQARTRFSGSLEDMAVVDVLQTIAVSSKSGVATVKRGEREAWIYFDRGQVIDAEVGDLRGEEAVYRTITWTAGSFDVEFRPIDRERVIDVSHNGLLMEGMRRVDELNRLAEQLPPEDQVVDVDHDELARRLNEIPDELNGILRLIDGKRTLLDLIDASPFDDLSTLTVLSKFYFEGLLLSSNPEPVEWAPGSRRSPAEEVEASATPATPLPPPATPLPPAAVLHTSPTLPVRDEAPPEAERERGARPALELLRETERPAPASEPAHEGERLTPFPATARAASVPELDVKLTPKGIVKVGDTLPPPPKSLPSPFRAASDLGRRSPIPMPAGNYARANGASRASSQTNGARESRTIHGLSATPSRQAPAPPPAESPEVEVLDAKAREAKSPAVEALEAEAPRRAVERTTDAAPGAAEPAVVPSVAREPAEPSAASGVPTPVVAAQVAEEASAGPGSNPASELEFFAAGEEGRYAVGSGSGSAAPGADAGSEPPAAQSFTPPRRPRPRRTIALVAGVLLVAAVPLVVAAWRHVAAPPEEGVGSGAPVAAEPPPPAAPQAGDGLGVALRATEGARGSGVAADAGVPARSGAESAAVMPTPAPAASTARASTPAEGAARVSEPRAVVPARAAAPARRPPAAASRAATPAPAPAPVPTAGSPAAKPAPAAQPALVAPAPSKPGEKPPTAAYPLQ